MLCGCGHSLERHSVGQGADVYGCDDCPCSRHQADVRQAGDPVPPPVRLAEAVDASRGEPWTVGDAC